MGLMGYIRSGLRQHWHVYGVVRDTSVDAFTPTIGFATRVVSVTVLLFFLLVGFVFWITSLHDKPDFESETEREARARRHQGSGELSPKFASMQYKTVPVAIVTALVDGDIYRWGSLMAGALIGSLPLVVLYAFFVEHYVSAMTGAVKE